jgi:ribosomal protein S18 acetylase RimI-like enzyme
MSGRSMKKAIKLRDATDADFDFLYAVHRAALKEYVDQTWGWDEGQQKEYFSQRFDPAAVRIIMLGKKDVGSISVSSDEHGIVVNRIELLPAYQNRGIGTHLIKKLLQRARSEHTSVKLQVIKVNKRAKTLYERLGFVVCGETDTHYQMRYL